MWTPFRLNDGRNGEFAAGWDTAVLNGNLLVFHTGAGMWNTRISSIRTAGSILLTNNQGFNPYRLTIGILRFFAPEIVK